MHVKAAFALNSGDIFDRPFELVESICRLINCVVLRSFFSNNACHLQLVAQLSMCDRTLCPKEATMVSAERTRLVNELNY